MNGDGAADVLVALLMDDQVALFLNSGDGSLSSPPVTIPVGVGPAGIATGDLDGDGDADLVTTDVFGDTISVVLNRGHATFHAPQSHAAGSDPVDVVLADLDGDGNTDVVVAGNTFPPTLHVFRNAGAGVLEPPTVISFFGADVFTGSSSTSY